MINDLKAMAIFSMVINKGSFKAAAEELGLSPSVVSYHISQLEKRLGSALIYRSTRHLRLTNEGEHFFKNVSDMLAAARLGIENLEGKSDEPTGQLSLSLPSALCHSPINAKIALFAKQYPKIALHINFTDHRDNVIEKGIDIAIRAGNLEDSNLKSKRIGSINRVLVCSPEYFAQQPTPRTVDDLAQWQWIKLKQLPNRRRFYSSHTKRAHDFTFNHQITVDNVNAMSHFCQLGLGLATLADYQANPLIEQQHLIHVLPGWQVEPITLHVIWPNNVSANSHSRRLLDFLQS